MNSKKIRFLATFMGIVFSIILTGAAQAQMRPWGFIPNASQRFQVISGFAGSVLDRETGLIWTKLPLSNTGAGQTFLVDWAFAANSCHQQSVNGRFGWRLPTVEELLALKELGVFGPDNTNIPLGHPFVNVLNDTTHFYWSATTAADNPSSAYGVSMSANQNTPTIFPKSDNRGIWCVRGGGTN